MPGFAPATDHYRGTALAAVGVLVLSFDALLVRLVAAPAAEIAFWRGLFIALSLTAALRFVRRRWIWADLRHAGIPGLFLVLTMGLTQILFVAAITHTRVANVVVILTAAPLFAALFSGVFLKEWIPLRTWCAIALCIAGIGLVFGGSVGGDGIVGDALALLLALVVGGNFTQLRRIPNLNRLSAVGGGGLVAALAALVLAAPAQTSPEALGVLAIMGLVQLPIALVMMTEATRYLPSAEVTLFLVVEAIFGSYWVWLVLGEEPPGATLLGGGIVIATLVGHSWIGLRRER